MTYHPGPVPGQGVAPQLRAWIAAELQRIAASINKPKFLQLDPLDTEPDKPNKAMIVWAAGVNWDPGAGEGLYVYNGATWDKVN